MLVSFCSDPRSAATSSQRADAEADGDGGAALDGAALDADPAEDAGAPAELPLELQAAAGSSTRLDRRMIRDT